MNKTVEFLKKATNNFTPDIAVVLGSGLGEFADDYCDISIPYSEIPYFGMSTITGHSGKLVFSSPQIRSSASFS